MASASLTCQDQVLETGPLGSVVAQEVGLAPRIGQFVLRWVAPGHRTQGKPGSVPRFTQIVLLPLVAL